MRIIDIFQKPVRTYVGFLGGDSSEWKLFHYAELNPEEQALVEKLFDPDLDYCVMDTIKRVLPTLLEELPEGEEPPFFKRK